MMMMMMIIIDEQRKLKMDNFKNFSFWYIQNTDPFDCDKTRILL